MPLCTQIIIIFNAIKTIYKCHMTSIHYSVVQYIQKLLKQLCVTYVSTTINGAIMGMVESVNGHFVVFVLSIVWVVYRGNVERWKEFDKIRSRTLCTVPINKSGK